MTLMNLYYWYILPVIVVSTVIVCVYLLPTFKVIAVVGDGGVSRWAGLRDGGKKFLF